MSQMGQMHRPRFQRRTAAVEAKPAIGESIEAGMIGFEGVVGLSALLGAEISGQQVIVASPCYGVAHDLRRLQGGIE